MRIPFITRLSARFDRSEGDGREVGTAHDQPDDARDGAKPVSTQPSRPAHPRTTPSSVWHATDRHEAARRWLRQKR